MARANKGARDQMMVYPSRAIGDVVRHYADALGLPHGEYIASVLAERFGHPYWAAAEVRIHEGGLPAMLLGVTEPPPAPEEAAWSERDVFVTKPVLALGQVVRQVAAQRKQALTRVITDEVIAYHSIDVASREVGAAPTSASAQVASVQLQREVQRLLA